MTKVHIYIRTTDGLGTDTKGLTIHELSPKEADRHYVAFKREHDYSAQSDGHKFIRNALYDPAIDGFVPRTKVHVAKLNGKVVGAVSHHLEPVGSREIHFLGSIHPGAGHALLRHVADISEREGSRLQGMPANERVHRLYSNLARREGGGIERVGSGNTYRLKRTSSE